MSSENQIFIQLDDILQAIKSGKLKKTDPQVKEAIVAALNEHPETTLRTLAAAGLGKQEILPLIKASGLRRSDMHIHLGMTEEEFEMGEIPLDPFDPEPPAAPETVPEPDPGLPSLFPASPFEIGTPEPRKF